MKKHFLYFFSLLISLCWGQEKEILYIQRHAKTAVEEMQIYKIPASITLAQGIHETASGTSELAMNANNHFGIKCKDTWTGGTYYKVSAEYYNNQKTQQNSCFRAYPTPEESYRDHSKFLAERPYYKALFNLPITDYSAWAYGLKSSGYATDPNYPVRLIHYIEKYNLSAFDKMPSEKVEEYLQSNYGSISPKEVSQKGEPSTSKEYHTRPMPEVKPVDAANRIQSEFGLKYTVLGGNETLDALAKANKTTVSNLLYYNDCQNVSQIKAGDRVYLQAKNKKGQVKVYKVQQLDTWHSISQKTGIQLSILKKLNRAKCKNNPKPGDTIRLQ
ncbi:MAG: mannosyl-glycoprotein endo-beta-N-acetylglucosamidase [Flavobacteriaceae bacterium]|nr:MAG: mannosyl-glycoprotein endo-beta-N-acetylglucosamidase [Flavobacteriaceae bacterium]